jgi:two-component system, cell cycle response regulator
MRILVADDEPISRHLMTSLLTRWGHQVVVARDGNEAWDILCSLDSPTLAIIDWMMPGLDGIELCRRVRARVDHPYTYILLVTARQEKQDIVDGLDAGADDYLGKPVDERELKARLRVGNRILDLQERLLKAYEYTRFEATHDSLTGLWNRRAILEFLFQQHSRAEREATDLSVLLIDLDHFKLVNDVHGHLVGDVVLQQVAERARRFLRTYDWLGRYGGEEFVIVAPGCTAPAAASMAERIRLAICSTPISVNGRDVPVAASIGVASHYIGDSPDSLLRAADDAMYVAKASGRNRIACDSAKCGSIKEDQSNFPFSDSSGVPFVPTNGHSD